MSNANRNLPEWDAGVVHSRATVDAASVSPETRTVEVIASTEDLDGHGTIVKQNWRLDRFRENPMVLFSHEARELPIGLASDVRVTDGQLRARIEFNSEEENERAEKVWKNVKGKKIRGVSVGFRPHSVKFEKHEDREVMVLDDNELLEISFTPIPSNPKAMAQLRSLAEAERETSTKTVISVSEDSEALAEAVKKEIGRQLELLPKQPEPPENKNMTTPIEQNTATPTVARALGLPAGATESDMVAACTRLRELEVQVLASTGVSTSSEGIGAMRALVASAAEAKTLREENLKLRSERDKQNFEAQVSRGMAERKLSPPLIQMYRDEFAQAEAEGRGAQVVARIKGHIDVGPTLHAETVRQQPAPSGNTAPLTHNGKSYNEMKPMERAKLARENPELWRAMKEDWEATRAA
jgi:HK97 family phage prohead protease